MLHSQQHLLEHCQVQARLSGTGVEDMDAADGTGSGSLCLEGKSCVCIERASSHLSRTKSM